MNTISTRTLLGIYLILPLILLFMAVDFYALEGFFKYSLPHFPEEILWYMLIFNFPHIIASFFSFADKEYLLHYKRPLIYGLPVILLGAVILPWLSVPMTILILILYTMYHNVSQQTGIASILMQHRDMWTKTWRWSVVLFALFLYVMVYPSTLKAIVAPNAEVIAIFFTIITTLLTIIIIRKSKTLIGKWYGAGTTGIAVTGMIALYAGYPIITITILRIIHDITAFIFYVNHDMNRNREVMHNFFYRTFLPHTKLFWIGIPLFGVLATYVIQGGGTATTIQIFFFVAVTHFFIEGFMWKNNSPHRAHVAFRT